MSKHTYLFFFTLPHTCKDTLSFLETIKKAESLRWTMTLGVDVKSPHAQLMGEKTIQNII